MFRADCHIEIGKYSFDFHTELEINSSWKNLTDTATIKFPRKLITKEGQLIQDVIKRGDKVSIAMGYDDNLTNRFLGYVTIVKAGIPVEIICEDEMFIHKQKSVKPYGWKNTTVAEVLKHLGINNFDAIGNIELGAFQIDEKIKSECGVFDKIKQQYGIHFFYRNGKLIIGKPYQLIGSKTHSYVMQKNVISNTLEYRLKDQIKIKVKAISNKANGENETIELGDNDGEIHTLNYYNLSKTALKERAESEMDKLKIDGYRGKLIVFGDPKISNGDIIKIKDEQYPERSGSFFIDSVITRTSEGIKQEIELGQKSA